MAKLKVEIFIDVDDKKLQEANLTPEKFLKTLVIEEHHSNVGVCLWQKDQEELENEGHFIDNWTASMGWKDVSEDDVRRNEVLSFLKEKRFTDDSFEIGHIADYIFRNQADYHWVYNELERIGGPITGKIVNNGTLFISVLDWESEQKELPLYYDDTQREFYHLEAAMSFFMRKSINLLLEEINKA
ncbi:hypothetical protein [Niallia taxi]|uniref:hypothetical protein n=1 Tax=Niallia taxi TaxID=2499688 RepID=UPI0015F5713F|nr:hypothetical protein [Niallia taxi]